MNIGNSLILIFFFCCNAVKAQQVLPDTFVQSSDTVIAAGVKYKRSGLHQWLWGKHYRKEWATPVRVPILLLDTAAGGLIPYKLGGRQSTSLYLRNAAGKEYIIKSLSKNFGNGLPEIYKGTFVENILNDQVSVAHPYAAVTIPPMAEAAQIVHSRPQIGFIPVHKSLDSFNNDFSNQLLLIEQHANQNWADAENVDSAKSIISTEDLYKYLEEDNHVRVHQPGLLKARLFDMFIGDWGRHEDQWRWAVQTEEDRQVFYPIPLGRDQAYTKFDGVLLKLALAGAGVTHLQSFDYKIKDVAEYNFPARFLDRKLLNETTLDLWINTAKDLQQLLTDSVIENSIRQLPPELYPISSTDIIAKLKSRRNFLQKAAQDYYMSLAKEVDILGTKQNEYFVINHLDNGETSVSIFRTGGDKGDSTNLFYSRVFNSRETKEIRLYGIGGNDNYVVNGNRNKDLLIRIVGGVDKDSITDRSSGSGKKTMVYDNPGNEVSVSQKTKLHLSSNPGVNQFRYDGFGYDKKGLSPVLFYNYMDRLFIGVAYKMRKYKWRREPFAYQHNLSARYSVIQRGPSIVYKGVVNQFIGKWNLSLNAYYDFIGWTNFFGIGNESPLKTLDRDFYRMRTRDGYAGFELSHRLGKKQSVGFSGFYQSVRIVEDTERYVAKFYSAEKDLFEAKNFGGARFRYSFISRNNSVLPSKGIDFNADVTYTHNLQERNRSVTRYTTEFNFYVPLSKRLILSVRNAAATLNGSPEFYQLNAVGGSNTLRGFRRDRFWGKSSFYNANELQWVFPVKSRLFNGRFGFVGLFDDGRVWQPGENSDTWHTAYGGGILVVPFEKLMFSVTYAQSKELGSIYLRYSMPLR